MPYSSHEGKAWAIIALRKAWMGRRRPPVFLDVGCGAGSWLDAVKPWFLESTWHGIEAWDPNITRFSLTERYDKIDSVDVRTVAALPKVDVVILGDVLEHMTRDEAKRLWSLAHEAAKVCVIGSVPIIHYPQDAHDGNYFEVHVQEHCTVAQVGRDFTPDEIEVGDVVAAFIKWTRRPSYV